MEKISPLTDATRYLVLDSSMLDQVPGDRKKQAESLFKLSNDIISGRDWAEGEAPTLIEALVVSPDWEEEYAQVKDILYRMCERNFRENGSSTYAWALLAHRFGIVPGYLVPLTPGYKATEHERHAIHVIHRACGYGYKTQYMEEVQV